MYRKIYIVAGSLLLLVSLGNLIFRISIAPLDIWEFVGGYCLLLAINLLSMYFVVKHNSIGLFYLLAVINIPLLLIATSAWLTGFPPSLGMILVQLNAGMAFLGLSTVYSLKLS
jgi:hypothetical protein